MDLLRKPLRAGLSRAVGPLSDGLSAVLERYLWFVPASAVLSLIGSGLEGFGLGLLIPLLTGLLDPSGVTGDSRLSPIFFDVAGMFPAEWRTASVAACIFVLIGCKGAFQTFHGLVVAWVDGRAGHDIRAALSERLLAVGYSFFLQQDPIRLVNIVSTESWRATDAIRFGFAMTSALGAVAVFGGLLFVVSWKLSLGVGLGVLLIRFTQTVVSKRLERLSQRIARTNQELAARMMTIIEAMRLIRVFGQQKREQQRFVGASDEVRKALLVVESGAAAMGPVFEVMHAALFIVILLLAPRAGLSLPATIAFLALLYRIQPHLMSLSNARLSLASLRGPVREVAWLLDSTDKPCPRSGSAPLPALDAPIRFEGVGFSYPTHPDHVALSDVSFDISPGRALAILGGSGSGKSTLVNLLCRLLEPTTGRISLKGQDLLETDLGAWLSGLALAGQDIELVDASIAENIAYGVPDASLERLVAAARLADAERFIHDLPRGYDTLVGNRGSSLSGGQRQRIGIARALLRDPEVLILDEATNAVDGISEKAIMGLIARRAGHKTTVVISHRASTIESCDDGVVLEGGRVVEVGPVTDLRFFQQMATSHVEPAG